MNAFLPKPMTPLRTWRPMILWSAGILAALGLAWFVAAVVMQLFETRGVIRSCVASNRTLVEFPARDVALREIQRTQVHMRAIELLGGARKAARRLSMFRSAPDWFTERGSQPDDLSNKGWAILLLGHCGQPGVAELLPMLQHQQGWIRSLALMALEEAGPEAAEAIPSIELLLSDEDAQIRSAAAEALKKIRGEAAKP